VSAAFTPGPWAHREGGSYCGDTGRYEILSDDDGWVVASTIGDVSDLYPQEEANARLMAAAPELFEALDDILIHCLADIEAEEQRDEPNERALAVYRARRDRANVALAKARGEQVQQ
jgi:hypothetical protein